MAYTLSWSKGVVSVSLTGVVDGAVLTAMASDIASDYRFDELRKRIYDCQEVECFDLGWHEIKTFIHVDSASFLTNPNAHIAMVICDDAIAESVAFYRHRFNHASWQMLVCDSLEQAQLWQPDHFSEAVHFRAEVAEPNRSAGYSRLKSREL